MTPLLERDDELFALSRALEEVAGGSARTVCVQGVTGIGKTALLDAVEDQARRLGWTVLRAGGAEHEVDFALAVLLQLLEPLVAEGDAGPSRLVGPASLLLPLMRGTGPSSRNGLDVASIAHGFYWIVAEAAERGPVLIEVDDVQWCDEATLRCLRYAIRRLGQHPIGLVLAARSAPEHHETGCVDAFGPVRQLTLGPLSRAAIAQLARATTDTDPDDAEIDRWHQLTGGVPLLVHELVEHQDVLESSTDLFDVTSATVSARRSRLSPEARRFIDAAAVAGDGAPRWIPDQLAGTEPCSARVLDEVVAAALLVPGDHVQFVHPAFGDAVLAQIHSDQVRELHGRIARLLLDVDAPPESIARHLMGSAPTGCPRAAAALITAATTIRTSGRVGHAVPLLERAMLERPSGAQRQAVLGELALCAALCGDPGWPGALDRFVRALETVAEVVAAHLRVGSALASIGRIDDATRVLLQGLDRAGSTEIGDLRMRLLTTLAANTRIDVHRRLRLEGLLEQELAKSNVDESAAARSVLALLAYHRSITTGPAATVREMARTALLHPAVGDDEILASRSSYYQGILALHFADDAEGMELALAHGFGAAERRGDERMFALLSNQRGALRLSQGRIDEAIEDLEAAVHAMRLQRAVTLPGAAANLALCRSARGEHDFAEAALDLAEVDTVLEMSTPYTHFLWTRGVLRLEVGDLSGIDYLRTVLERQRANDSRNPAAVPAALRLAEALVTIDRAEAEALIDESTGFAEAFDAPRPIAEVLRIRALLEPDRALPLLHEAEQLLAGTPWGLERMRIRLALGQALIDRSDIDGARLILRLVLEEAASGGALAFEGQARDLLRVVGVRPRRSAVSGTAALTPAERAVARLAAAGLTNREIAARRFVSVKAVEYHLGNVYRKLGIANRAELAGALSRLGSPLID